jgi:predicted amidohydrolase
VRAHLVQYDIIWEDREANFARVRDMLAPVSVEAGDLIVLPEMFDSGFSLNTDTTGDGKGESRKFLSGLARATGAFVVGGITIKDEGAAKARNRCLAYAPDGGVVASYDKVHPFTFGREGEQFAGGDRLDWFEMGDDDAALRVCPLVCYDLRFPELFRAGLAGGAMAFTVIANWPRPRAAHWRALLIARAIENQALVLGVNRCGRDPHLVYAGGTIAIGPTGDVLGECGDDERVLSINVDMETVREWRSTFPAWIDAKQWLWPRGGGEPPRPSG